jgi:vacuolar-type H+-ATPase subunit I/STV1
MSFKYDNKTKLFEGLFNEELDNSEDYGTSEVEPPTIKNKFPIWNDENENWDYITDYRGQVAFDKTTLQEIKIDFLGELSDNLTLDNPNNVEFPIFDNEQDKFVTNETKKEIDNYQKEIEQLKIELANSDYKVIKCSEASLSGYELPYNIQELLNSRNNLRNRINELQTKINELEEDELK